MKCIQARSVTGLTLLMPKGTGLSSLTFGEDVFVHRHQFNNASYLTAGGTVTYELQLNQRKSRMQAVNVWILVSDPTSAYPGGGSSSQSSQSLARGSSQWTSRRGKWETGRGPQAWHGGQASAPDKPPDGPLAGHDSLATDLSLPLLKMMALWRSVKREVATFLNLLPHLPARW